MKCRGVVFFADFYPYKICFSFCFCFFFICDHQRIIFTVERIILARTFSLLILSKLIVRIQIF